MSNVALDHATRQRLRELISRARLEKVAVPPPEVYELCRNELHEMSPENTGRDTRGRRFCRQCRRDRQRESSARRRLGNPGPGRLRGVCKQGHPIEGENAAPAGNGKKRCRICLNAAQRKYKRQRRLRGGDELRAKERAYSRAYYHRRKFGADNGLAEVAAALCSLPGRRAA